MEDGCKIEWRWLQEHGDRITRHVVGVIRGAPRDMRSMESLAVVTVSCVTPKECGEAGGWLLDAWDKGTRW